MSDDKQTNDTPEESTAEATSGAEPKAEEKPKAGPGVTVAGPGVSAAKAEEKPAADPGVSAAKAEEKPAAGPGVSAAKAEEKPAAGPGVSAAKTEDKPTAVPSVSASTKTEDAAPAVEATPTVEATESAEAPAEEAPTRKLGSVPKRDPSEIDLSSVNALVVEDDAGGMAIIGVMMRFLNIKAYINTTGEGVVQMAKAMRPRPNIVFCDINLPRTTGYNVLSELRADPELQDIMVIAVTAQDADTEIPKAREAGFNGYIGKPLNRMRFPKQLRRILAGEEVWETY